MSKNLHSELQLPAKDVNVVKVMKRGVEYIFNLKGRNNHEGWVRNAFPTWEEDTFDVFELCKNNDKIAIDLGGWIGTTCIWLSKHFKKVVVVEADPESVLEITKNIELSGCSNVDICNKAIYNEVTNVIFGSHSDHGGDLNRSMSHIKNTSEFNTDVSIETITLGKILMDYNISVLDIAFIKCDIEGGEEYIFEELLTFCMKNKIPLFLSFHIFWWKDQNLERFRNLFENVKYACKYDDIIDSLRQNGGLSIHFQF